MAIEQLFRGDSASDSSCQQELNFLAICESVQNSSKGVLEIDRKNSQRPSFLPEEEIYDGSPEIDFSVPIFPFEKQPAAEVMTVSAPAKADVQTKPANKYEKIVASQLNEMNDEARFSIYTKDALLRDADKFPPVRNQAENTTTYQMELFGFSDRDIAEGANEAQAYKRLVTVTVPDGAGSIKDCKFEFQDRRNIEQKELNELISRAQQRQVDMANSSDTEHKLPRPNDLAFFTHGIRTAGVSSDLYALSLQLTSGHSVVNVDWKSVPPSEETGFDMEQKYNDERNRAAKSYQRFEKLIDETIEQVGADRTTIIAFSHGAMFNTRYLQHRKASGSEQLNHVIFSHPDVPCRTLPQPGADGMVPAESRLFSCVAKQTHVIGSPADLALIGAAKNDEPRVEGRSKLSHYLKGTDEAYARIGNGAKISRNLVEGSGGTYVIETQKGEKKDLMCHFINMQSIGELMNSAPKLRVAAGMSAEK